MEAALVWRQAGAPPATAVRLPAITMQEGAIGLAELPVVRPPKTGAVETGILGPRLGAGPF